MEAKIDGFKILVTLDDDYNVCKDFVEVMVDLFRVLMDQCDCDFFGETYCCGNAVGVAQDFYSYNSGYIYRVLFQDVEELIKNRDCSIYGRQPDDGDKEQLEELFGD